MARHGAALRRPAAAASPAQPHPAARDTGLSVQSRLPAVAPRDLFCSGQNCRQEGPRRKWSWPCTFSSLLLSFRFLNPAACGPPCSPRTGNPGRGAGVGGRLGPPPARAPSVSAQTQLWSPWQGARDLGRTAQPSAHQVQAQDRPRPPHPCC